MNRYLFVPAYNGIELYFEEKPEESVREEMKSNGWRWHSAKKCWYTKNSPAAEEFAKKICTPLTEAVEKKAKSSQPSSVTIQQSAGNVPVGTLTICRSEQGYSLSSTNNQIICCDCHMFFSIHAGACPFCGCPISYVAEYYYKAYDPEVIRQQQIQQERQRREEQKKEEEQERQEIIQELGSHSFEIRWRLHGKKTQTLRCARDRANRLRKLEAPICLSDESYVELLCGRESQFEKAFQRASQIKAQESVLPVIGDKEWQRICSLNDTAFYERVRELIVAERERRDKAEAYANKKKEEKQAHQEEQLKNLCGRYGIGEDRLKSMVAHYGSKQAVLHKLQLVDTIGGEYRNRISVINHLDSPDTLQRLVNDLARQK